jgi:hypothetical protein
MEEVKESTAIIEVLKEINIISNKLLQKVEDKVEREKFLLFIKDIDAKANLSKLNNIYNTLNFLNNSNKFSIDLLNIKDFIKDFLYINFIYFQELPLVCLKEIYFIDFYNHINKINDIFENKLTIYNICKSINEDFDKALYEEPEHISEYLFDLGCKYILNFILIEINMFEYFDKLKEYTEEAAWNIADVLYEIINKDKDIIKKNIIELLN